MSEPIRISCPVHGAWISCPVHGISFGTVACCSDAAGHVRELVSYETQPLERIKEMLVWARANRFRVREIESDGIRLVVDDLGDKPPATVPPPRSAHEAIARQLGIEYHEDDDEDRPDPVEGQG